MFHCTDNFVVTAFVIIVSHLLLVHTPDYIEDVSVANTDLALAGHTHGGQVRVFGDDLLAVFPKSIYLMFQHPHPIMFHCTDNFVVTAFVISDLHYKSLLKEQGLNNLVRLLIAQKADVLLMGGVMK